MWSMEGERDRSDSLRGAFMWSMEGERERSDSLRGHYVVNGG